MRIRLLSCLLLVLLAASASTAQTGTDKPKFSPPSRKFRFTYSFTVKE